MPTSTYTFGSALQLPVHEARTLVEAALQADPSIGALLPCNVVIRDHDGQTIVEAMDPRAVMDLVENPEVAAVAAEAEARLRRVIASLGPDLSDKAWRVESP